MWRHKRFEYELSEDERRSIVSRRMPHIREYYEGIRRIVWGNLLQAIGHAKQPNPRGEYYLRCFFHNEKTPSLKLIHGGWFHCFGCGAHGDIFEFIIRLRGMTPPEASRFFKHHFGIPTPKQNG